jgi:hypothetical protein
LPFATSTPVPEASAAAWMKIDGKDMLVVVGDSGQHGAYGLVDPETGETTEQGKLPLGEGGDDIEGLSTWPGPNTRLYGLTSAGWMRVWERVDHGFKLFEGPYPIGEGNMICGIDRSNCARDYEGLCLRPAHGGLNPLFCAGYVASRTDGALYCLTMLNEPNDLQVDRSRSIKITRKGALADCAYGADGTLWAANNLFGDSQVYRIDHEFQPDKAKVVPIAQIGVGFPEVVAVRGDTFWRMSDAGGTPSLMSKFRCRPSAR